VRYQHRTNPRLVAYSDDRVVAVGTDHYHRRRDMIAASFHARGRPGDQQATTLSRTIFRLLYQLDLTRRNPA
jgi:hypothetical protein